MTSVLKPRLLAVATAALFVLSLVGLEVVDPGESSVVAAAAAATTRTGSARVEVTSVSSSSGSEFRVTGTGVVDFGSRRSSSTVTGGPANAAITTVTDDGVVYVKATPGTSLAAFAKGKQWVGLELEGFGTDLTGIGVAPQGDPLESLRAMARDGLIEEVRDEGPDEVRGVRTTRYAGTVRPDRLKELVSGMLGSLAGAAASGAVKLEAQLTVWVSDDGLIRRFSTSASVAFQSLTMTSTTTAELFDFGRPVDIDVPPADQVRRGATLQELLEG